MKTLSPARVRKILQRVRDTRILVVGDIMLDQFVWGRVRRISPEAPVPVVEFQRENWMPGGAANVARNLTSLNAKCDLMGLIGCDAPGEILKRLLEQDEVGCQTVVSHRQRQTSVKTRVIAHQQQLVRVDRESTEEVDAKTTRKMLSALDEVLPGCDAVIVGDYGKGVVTQPLLDHLKARCREQGTWLSLDPKPVHALALAGISLITPNRKEAFELAGIPDGARQAVPLEDPALLRVAEVLLRELRPALLLITLGDQGMLLCRQGQAPFHIPTVAQEVFDVSGAGDTVIASFTLAIAAGASPLEAAIFSNHAAGVVVGKVGTAVVTEEELLGSFRRGHS